MGMFIIIIRNESTTMPTREDKYIIYILWFSLEVSIANAFIPFTHYCIATELNLGIKSKPVKKLLGDYRSQMRTARLQSSCSTHSPST